MNITHERWVTSILESVLGGHSARTRELVTAVLAYKGADPELLTLQGDLDRGGPVKQNRAVRQWLEEQGGEAVIRKWSGWGFPAPPADSQASQILMGLAAPSRVVIFDFDQVLSTVEVGLHMLQSASERAFGGSERVSELDDMLTALGTGGVALAIVSRNSRHIIQRSLSISVSRRGTDLWRHFAVPGMVFGWEDYDDGVTKSQVIAERVLPSCRLPASSALFVDDMLKNVADVRGQCPGISVLHVKGGGGLNGDGMRSVLDWAQLDDRDGRPIIDDAAEELGGCAGGG